MAVILIKITTNGSVDHENGHIRDEVHETLTSLENLIGKIKCGNKAAQVDVVISGTDQTITANSGGKSVSHNKK